MKEKIKDRGRTRAKSVLTVKLVFVLCSVQSGSPLWWEVAVEEDFYLVVVCCGYCVGCGLLGIFLVKCEASVCCK